MSSNSCYFEHICISVVLFWGENVYVVYFRGFDYIRVTCVCLSYDCNEGKALKVVGAFLTKLMAFLLRRLEMAL